MSDFCGFTYNWKYQFIPLSIGSYDKKNLWVILSRFDAYFHPLICYFADRQIPICFYLARITIKKHINAVKKCAGSEVYDSQIILLFAHSLELFMCVKYGTQTITFYVFTSKWTVTDFHFFYEWILNPTFFHCEQKILCACGSCAHLCSNYFYLNTFISVSVQMALIITLTYLNHSSNKQYFHRLHTALSSAHCRGVLYYKKTVQCFLVFNTCVAKINTWCIPWKSNNLY